MPASTDRFYLPVSLNGRGYQIDVSKYTRDTLPVRRDGQDPSREPSEQSLTQQGHWNRHASDWSLGQGQLVYDEQFLFGGTIDRNSQRSQYRTSKGIDPWTKNKLQLLHDTASIRTLGTSSARRNRLLAVQAGSYLYIVDGTNLVFTANPTAAVPTFTTIAIGSAIVDITSDDTYVYVSTSTNVFQTTIGSGTASAFGAISPAGVIIYANGRLLVANGTILKEVSSTGTTGAAGQLSYTLRAGRWNCATSAPNGIYVATDTEIYLITENASSGALNTPIVAVTLPVGEYLRCMLSYGSLMVLGTSRGIRLAVTGQGGELSYGPVIPINDGIVNGSQIGVEVLAASGQYIWFGWDNYDTTSVGIGRMDLQHYTEGYVPAYASDLMAPLPSAPTAGQTDVVDGLAVIAGMPFFSTHFHDTTYKLYQQQATYENSGVIHSGKIRFGTFEKKRLLSVDVRHEVLPTAPNTGAVVPIINLDDGTSITAGSSVLGLGPTAPYTVTAYPACEEVEVQITLQAAKGGTITPVLKRWTLSGMAQPRRQEQFLVPLVWKHVVLNSEEGEATKIPYDDLRAEYVLLKTLEAAGSVIDFMEGDTTHKVMIDGVKLLPERWDDNVQFFEGLILVTLLSVVAAS